MATLTVRNLPDEVHRALRMRAAQHGRSTEAEVREILADTIRPEQRLRMGDAMAALASQHGLKNSDVDALEQSIEETRDKKPAEPMRF